MRNPYYIIASFALLVAFSACGDDSGTASAPNGADRQVSTMEELLNCTDNRAGEIVYVTEQKSTYVCADGEWMSFVPTMDDLFYCTENREGKTVYVTEQNSSFVCKDGTWESVTDMSSSAAKSSSSAPQLLSSSAVVLANSCKSETEDRCEYGELIDSRDGQIYKTVKIGDQVWMAQNLNFKTDSSFCFKNEESNCMKYGRIYRWAAAMGKLESECGFANACTLPSGNIQGACPGGWHLPSKVEWESLFNAVGGQSTAGNVLKSTSGWNDGGDGTDAFGFSAIPASCRINYGSYDLEGYNADFWSSSEYNFIYAYYVNLKYDNDGANLGKSAEINGYSVRCLKNEASVEKEEPNISQIIESSSSQASSSSSIKVLSSDSVNADCGDLWCGLDDDPRRVKTGSENDSAGYWFAFNDEGDGGNSNISFPSDVKPDRYGYFFGTLAEAYGGIKGSFTMGDGYEYPYVGFSFNLVSEKQEGMDIADWGGVCLVYQSSVAFSIELGVENEKDVTGLNNYRIHVPRSVSMTTADFPWHKFKQESGWGEWVDQDTVLSKTAQIKLVFRNFAAGVSGEFLIQSIGRYGTCSNASNSYLSSSSVAK